MKLHCVDALSLPFHMVTETSPQPVPIKKKKKRLKIGKKTSLKWFNTWQLSKSLRVFPVVFSWDQYWAQSFWKCSRKRTKLVLNPVYKIFSGATISSALMMMRTEQFSDFGSFKQNKWKLLCLIRRNGGQAGKWEVCPRKQWLRWMRGAIPWKFAEFFLAHSRNRLAPSLEEWSALGSPFVKKPREIAKGVPKKLFFNLIFKIEAQS